MSTNAPARPASSPRHWLDRYATDYHRWQYLPEAGDAGIFIRPLGLVETAFDHDGTDFEGRADVYARISCNIRTRLSRSAIRTHILRAWAAMRAQHVLLRARVDNADDSSLLAGAGLQDECFVIQVPASAEALMLEAQRTTTFVDDFYSDVDRHLFLRHSMNTARSVNVTECASGLYVLPLEQTAEDRYALHLILVCGHEILDGLTTFTWGSQFIDMLNQPSATLSRFIGNALDPAFLRERLPPAQEDIYPKIKGSRARQRWFWAISRILRHVRTPTLPSFPNPLRRDVPLQHAQPMEPPLFSKVLNYDTLPPLNTFLHAFSLSPAAVANMRRLCGEAKTSIGAGGFALVAIGMMASYEQRYPQVPPAERRAFVASFPLDPRPFLSQKTVPDSLMLSFSDGASFPFLPSYIPIEARFKFFAKLAHRQLGIYQKRPRTVSMQTRLGARSSIQLIPSLYTAFVERIENLRTEDKRQGFSPQGSYPAQFWKGNATCGVSSVGNILPLVQGSYRDLDGSSEFQASFAELRAQVRAREDEFLCGIAGLKDSITFAVSFDGNAIDEQRVAEWGKATAALLEPKAGSKL